MADTLPWNQPWTFVFDSETGKEQIMNDIGKNLHNYVVTELGANENFTLYLTWSQSQTNMLVYRLYANLTITQKKMLALLSKNKVNAVKDKAEVQFGNNLDDASVGGTKTPPPPPPPPIHTIIAGMPVKSMNQENFVAVHEQVFQGKMSELLNHFSESVNR